MISNRSKSSLCIYLTLHSNADVRLFFHRYGIAINDLEQGMAFTPYVTDSLRSAVFAATSGQLLTLLEGFVRTSGDLRSRISLRYRHDERWEDLLRCLELDGYRIEGQNLIAIEPEIEGASTREDDLTTTELNHSGLQEIADILEMIERSAQDFRKTPPDYNGCLANARVALESLGKSIAIARGCSADVSWGQALSYLRTSCFISESEEKAIAGVYGFVSQGAHRPVAFSEQETARLGRNLAISMCYFIIKLYKQTQLRSS